MSIASRIEAIEQHLTDDYSVLTLAGADLTNVDKNILNLKPTWKERLLYFMNNGTDVVWNNWNKVSGTGTSLTLNNTEEAPMSLVYKGNTQQTGTPTPSSPIPVQVVSGDNSIEVCGINIFDEVIENGYINYQTGQNVPGGNYRRSKNYIKVTPGQTYYLYLGDVVNTAWIGLESYDANKNWLRHGAVNTKSTFTVANDCEYIRFYMGESYYDKICINVNNASINGKYYAYEGASYPISLGDIELCKIGTYQDKIDKSTGKNLFNINATKTDFSTYIYKYEYQLEPNTKYTISSNCPQSGTANIYANGTSSGINNVDINQSRTITSDSNGSFYILIRHQATGETGTMDMYSKILDGTYYLQIEKGKTTTDYEPYGTGWYLKKEIGKVVLDGSESWIKGDSNGRFNLNVSDAFLGSASNNPILCTHFQQRFAITNYSIFLSSASHQFGVIYQDINWEVADFQSWLSTHNTTVYYVLATPTYETITDTTLIGQLEALKKSYEEQTNISQTNNDMPFELDITALEEMN